MRFALAIPNTIDGSSPSSSSSSIAPALTGPYAADTGRSSPSRHLYRQTLDSHPGSVPTYIGLAQASLRLGNLLAAAYSGTGRYALAIETLEQFLHHPDFDLGHVNIGGMYGKLGHYQEAEKHLLMAQGLNPDNSVTHR